MDQFRLIVAGGRDFTDYPRLRDWLDSLLILKRQIHTIVIVEGECNEEYPEKRLKVGADQLAKRYALERGYTLEPYPADWRLHGKSAGPKRNTQMSLIGHAAAVVWDGKSKGSADMIRQAKARNIPTKILPY